MSPVSVSGIRKKRGNIILGDDPGVIAIPSESAERVLTVTLEIAEKKAKIEEGLADGMTLRKTQAAVNYHSLQTHIDTNLR